MRDSIGNRITEGALLHWSIPPQFRNMVVRVLRVNQGGISVVGAGKDSNTTTPPVLTIQIDLPVQVDPRSHQEPVLTEFVRIVDPNAEIAVEKMLQ